MNHPIEMQIYPIEMHNHVYLPDRPAELSDRSADPIEIRLHFHLIDPGII